MIKKYIFLAPMIIFVIACKNGQHQPADYKPVLVSAKVGALTQAIARENVVMGASVGFLGARPEQWDRYQKLANSARVDELLALTDDTNAVVRCYAFQALRDRKHKHLDRVLRKHETDTVGVHTLFGCIGGEMKVVDYFKIVMNN